MSDHDPSHSAPSHLATLSAAPPMLSPRAAIALAQEAFGLACITASTLTAERDQNLLLREQDGRGWVMKIINPSEPRLTTDFQTAAQLHLLGAEGALPIPKLRMVKAGSDVADYTVETKLEDGRTSVVRMMEFYEGSAVAAKVPSPALRSDMAQVLARIDLAFEGFNHPGQHFDLQWDSSRLDRMANLLPSVDNPVSRAHLEGVLQEFAATVLPSLPDLRRQVIYNDLNFFNILVDPEDTDRVGAIIDFGDIVTAPLINDLAVAASYQFGGDGDRSGAGAFIAAYCQVLPLRPEEIALLPLLIQARLALTLLITGYRAARYPENATYILRNNAPARHALAELRSRSAEDNIDWAFGLTEMR